MGYMPYQITYMIGSTLTKEPCQNYKRAIAVAREATKKGYSHVTGYKEVETEDGTGYTLSSDLNNVIARFPSPKRAKSAPGSIDAYNALNMLSAITAQLALVAKKTALNDKQQSELLGAMENVDDVLGLTGPHAFTDEVPVEV